MRPSPAADQGTISTRSPSSSRTVGARGGSARTRGSAGGFMPARIGAEPGQARVGEGNRLGLSVSRICPGDKELDAHPRLRVAKLFAPFERRDISETFELPMNLGEPFGSNQEIDVVGKAAISLEEHRHAAHERVR